MKILIVDDEPAARVFFRKAAERWGEVETAEARDGDEALVAVMRRKYDLITVDLNMPGKGGLEILPPLRNFCPHAIVAVVSAHLPEELDADYAGSADILIEKPVGFEAFCHLLDSVKQIIDAREGIGEIGRVPPSARS